MGIRVGFCGPGAFGRHFIPLFKEHPAVEGVVLCDLKADLLEEAAREYDIAKTCPSLDELCQTDVDAIALFTQNHVHGPQAVQALRAGKHVYSAVPSAISVEEMTAIVRAVETTGRVYMIGETSYYYPGAIYCRERFRKGDFGHVFYSEGEYHHDKSHGGEQNARRRYGERWRELAGIPPLFYPTHSMAFVTSVTGAHATRVCGMGYVDRENDGVFGEHNGWQNPFSNETMLCRMSDGGMARVSCFWRIASWSCRMSVFGTKGCYEEQPGSCVWTTLDRNVWRDLTLELSPPGCRIERTDDGRVTMARPDKPAPFGGATAWHPVDILPEAYRDLPSGHAGSHQFLVNEFVTACVDGRQPANNVWQAARYLLPGLVAHESAKRGGELMDVPDFGDGSGVPAGSDAQ